MNYILAFVIYSSTCTLGQIRDNDCSIISTDYTSIQTVTIDQCQAKAMSPRTKLIIEENYSKVWVVPMCQTYTREVAMKINYNLSGI